MSGISARRRRATRVGAVVSGAAILVACASLAVGANVLYHTTEGKDAAQPELEARPLPQTPNLLLGVTDDGGDLASAAVLTLAPTGAGGSIVTLPVNASPTRPNGDVEVTTLADSFEQDGDRAFGVAATSILGVSFDQVAVADADELAGLLEDVGPVQVDLPADVVGGIGGTPSVLFDAGAQQLEPDDIAEALSARWDGEVSEVDRAESDENTAALWDAVAGGIGSGLDTGAAVGIEVGDGLEQFVARQWNGPLSVRRLASDVVEADPDGAGDGTVVLVHRPDVLLVFGQISPRKVAAPLDSISIRLVVPFSEEGVSNTTIALRAIERLTFSRVNVTSVSTAASEEGAPDVSQIELVNRTLQLTDEFDDVVGENEIVDAEYIIPGVDVVVTLGDSALSFYDGS